MLIVIFACVLAAFAGFVLVMLVFWPRQSASPAASPSQSGGSYAQQPYQTSTTGVTSPQAEAAKQAFGKEIAPYNNDNVQLLQTSVVGQYALQLWRGDHTGGEALLKFDDRARAWTVVSGGGGQWSVGGLVGFGVPTSTAEALLQGLPK